MQLSGELASLGYAHRETEFVLIPGMTTRLYGACGPTALASCASAALQKLVTTEQMYTLMRGRGLCDASGVSNDVKLAAAAVIATNQGGSGLAIDEHHSYSGSDVWHGWQTFLGWHLGSCDHPTLIELAHGQQLKDEISGLGENAAGLTYHFICLIKRHGGGYSAYAGKNLPSGYWACDGDSYAGANNRANGFHAADVLQFYSDTTLTAAMPCAGIAFKRTAIVTTGTGTGGGSVAGVPSGWHDDGATLTAPNDEKVVLGFRQHILSENWPAALQPLGGEYGASGGDEQVFALKLKWENGGAQELAGPDYPAQIAALQQQLAAANAEIATLKAAPTLTVQQQKDLAIAAAIRAALA